MKASEVEKQAWEDFRNSCEVAKYCTTYGYRMDHIFKARSKWTNEAQPKIQYTFTVQNQDAYTWVYLAIHNTIINDLARMSGWRPVSLASREVRAYRYGCAALKGLREGLTKIVKVDWNDHYFIVPA